MRMVRSFDCIRCSGSSRVMPIAPNTCIAWSTTSYATEMAYHVVDQAMQVFGAALVELPGAVVGHQPGGVDAGGGVGDHPLHALPLRQRGAEGRALRGELDDHLQRPLGHADRPAGHLDAAGAEANLHRREALALLAEQLPAGNAAVLQQDLERRLAAEHRDLAQDVEAGRVLVDEKGGHAAARAL